MIRQGPAPLSEKTVPGRTGNDAEERVRLALEDKKNELLASRRRERIFLVATERASEEDQAQVLHGESVELSLNGFEYETLCMVEEALDRLDAGDFGRCLACGKSIPFLRLQAIPWARYCVICRVPAISTGQGKQQRMRPPAASAQR